MGNCPRGGSGNASYPSPRHAEWKQSTPPSGKMVTLPNPILKTPFRSQTLRINWCEMPMECSPMYTPKCYLLFNFLWYRAQYIHTDGRYYRVTVAQPIKTSCPNTCEFFCLKQFQSIHSTNPDCYLYWGLFLKKNNILCKSEVWLCQVCQIPWNWRQLSFQGGCWELNLGPLPEQPMLLSDEPTLTEV